MEIVIRFDTPNEDEYVMLMTSSILPDETWELYDENGNLVRSDNREDALE